MRHILSREEFLNTPEVNEGFFKDTFNKVRNKISSWFVAGMKKVKGFIAVFDNKGNVLPVVTSQASVDHLSEVDGVQVFATSALSDDIKAAGGSGVSNRASYSDGDDKYYSPYPKFNSRAELVKWLKSGEYKNSNEYKNFQTFAKIVNESIEKNASDAVNEDMESKYSNRKGYSATSDETINQALVKSIGEMKAEIKKCVQGYVHPKTIKKLNRKTGQWVETNQDLHKPLIMFGAPGLGKSTIPRAVCDAWNDAVGDDINSKIALITVDLMQISPGDLMMPQIAQRVPVSQEIEKSSMNMDKSIQKTGSFKNAASEEEQNKVKDKIEKALGNLEMPKAKLSPQTWFPGYYAFPDEDVNEVLDDWANCGIHTRGDKELGTNRNRTEKTAGGGILFFDETFRADPDIFTNLMNLFTDRQLNGWRLGSKWFILGASNRPADDSGIFDTLQALDSARMDRWEFRIVQPDPKDWREWAEENLYPDPIVLDYIFSKVDGTTGEYPRFQTDVDKEDFAKTGSQLKPVSPRMWENVINRLNEYFDEDGKTSVAQYSKYELIKIINEVADKDLAEHFAEWVENNVKSIKLEEILKYNEDVKSRKKSKLTEEQAKSEGTIMDALKDKIDAYIKENGNLSDAQMASVFTWIAHNFPNYHYSIANFEAFLPDFAGCSTETSKIIDLYPQTLLTIAAAYPRKEMEDIWNGDDELDKKVFDKEKIIELCKKEFPNNIKGDKIIFANNWDE